MSPRLENPILNATNAIAGKVELATAAEIAAKTAAGGSGAPLIISPDLLANHPGVLNAWQNFNGQGTIAARDSNNCDAPTDNGTGDYTVNWSTDFTAANYAWWLSCGNTEAVAQAIIWSNQIAATPAVGTLRIGCHKSGAGAFDPLFVCVGAVGT